MHIRRLLRGLLLPAMLLGCQVSESCQSSTVEADKNSPVKQTEAEIDHSTGPATYELLIRWVDVNASFVATVNGFPVRRRLVKGRAVQNEFDLPLNSALIGGTNRVEIRLHPLIKGGEGEKLHIGTTRFEASILGPEDQPFGSARITRAQAESVSVSWRERVKEQWRTYLGSTSSSHEALDSIRAWAERTPMTVRTTFDNEAGPDFSRIFEEAPVIEGTPSDTARLKDYALRLRDLMARRDTAALFEEFRLHYAHQYEITGHEGSVEEDEAALKKTVVMEDPNLDFAREDVRLTRWSDGRVWEIARDGADEFFRSKGTVRDVYVAEVDGELRVVR